MKENRVAIIGGEGAMGKMTNQLFQNIGFETVVSDIKNADSPTPIDAVRNADIVFFSVLPISEIPKIIDAIGDTISPSNIILDNAGLKKPIEKALERLDEQGLSVCSTHPLCGPNMDLAGEKVLIMNVGKNFRRAKALAERLYTEAEMQVVPSNFDGHDERMVISQLVPHFIMRATAEMFAKNGLDMQDLWSTATANFQLFLLSLSRVAIQDPAISANTIQGLLDTETGDKFISDLLMSMGNMIEKKTLTDSFKQSSESLLDADTREEMTVLTHGVIKIIKAF